jgi:hypothetical protein
VRTLRLMLIAVAGLVGVVVLVVGGVLLLSDRESVRAALRPRLEKLLSDSLRLDVKIADITGLSLWKGVRVTGVSLSHDGEQMIGADALHVRIGLERLLPPLISIRAEGDAVAVDMEKRPDGTWNLVQAFSSEEEAEKSPPPSWLDAVTVVLRDGRVRVGGLAAQPLEVGSVEGTAVVVLGDPGVLTIKQLDAQLGAGSQLAATGWLQLGAPSGVDLALDVHTLAGSDVKPFAPQVAESASLTGSVSLTGTFDAPTVEAHLAQAPGPGSVDLWASVGGDDAGRKIVASWQTLALDPATLVDGAPAASVSGAGSIDTVLGADSWPTALAGDARFWSTRVADVGADWLTAQARRDGDRILLDVQMAAPDGAATVDLASWVGVAEPHAAGGDLRFAVLRPAALPEPVPSALGDSELRGRLTASADRVAGDDRIVRAELQLEPGRLRGVKLDRALARARLEAGVASVDELRVEGGATRLLAWGWTQLTGAPEQRELRAGFVGPVDLGLVPDARGMVVARGSAWGTMAAIDAEAAVKSDGGVVLPGASGTFDVSATAKRVSSPDPSANVVLKAKLAPDRTLASALGDKPRDLDVKLAWRRPRAGEATLVASATADDGAPDQVSVDLAATEPDRRKHAFSGLIELRGATVAARLDQLRVTPPKGPPWSLLQPATVSYAPDRITAQKVELGSRAGRVGVSGVLARDARNDMSLTVTDLDLKDVCTIAGLTQPCGGILVANVALAGTPKAPSISGAVHVRNLSLSGQGYGGADLTLATEERLVVRGTLGKAPMGPLDLAARVPIAGGWPAPTLDQDGKLDATITGNDIQLTGFRAFAESALSQLGGEADLQVTVTGTPAAPRLAGGLTATGLRVGLVATGTVWQDGRLRLSFADRSVRLDELSFHDGHGGTVSGSGALALAGDEQGVDVQITLSSLAVLARPEIDADASGKLRIGGSVASPRITGDVHIDSATIRPALLPGGGGPPPDDTIKVHYAQAPPDQQQTQTIGEALADVPGANPSPQEKAQAQAQPAMMDRIAMAITVTLGDPVVVQRVDAYVRLNGQVYVTKEPADALRITGQISSERGWYMFRGRRIVLQSAFVSFSGETPIDPYLTVTATYQVPDYIVTVRVEGTARAPKLDLSSDPPLDQSDVLALLLFGKTTSQLTGGQGTELRQEAIGILASYVAPELEQSLMDTFGLASLTFQLPTGTSYGSVGVGRYFGDDIFISLGQTFGGPQGGTSRQLGGLIGSSLTVQYYLTPNITLQTSSSTEGESALDAIWHMRY